MAKLVTIKQSTGFRGGQFGSHTEWIEDPEKGRIPVVFRAGDAPFSVSDETFTTFREKFNLVEVVADEVEEAESAPAKKDQPQKAPKSPSQQEVSKK